MYFLTNTFYQKWEKKGYKNFPVSVVFEAETFGEVERKVAEKMESSELEKGTEIKTIAPYRISDLFFNEESAGADKWWRAKITYDGEINKSGKAKKIVKYVMVFAFDSAEALKVVEKELKGWQIDPDIEAIDQTKIRDIYPHIKKEKV